MPGNAPATILVLERLPAASELIEQALRESGDRVLVTSNPIEGLELARRIRIDLLVSDTVLLAGDEQALLEHLRSAEPGFRVIYLIGRENSGTTLNGDAIALGAPFSLAALRDAVTQALGRSA